MKKVVITNTVALNGGDAAILIAIKSLLSREFHNDFELLVYDNQPEVAARYYPEFEFRKQFFLKIFSRPPRFRNPRVRAAVARARGAVHRRRLRLGVAAFARGKRGLAKLFLSGEEMQDLETFDQADVVISTGGTYLVENYDLAGRISDFRVVLDLGSPLVLFTQSLGPFLDPENRRAFAQIFRQTSRILLRDHASLKNCADLGIDLGHVRVSADAVFALADPEVLVRAKTRRFLSPGGPLRIGISVRDWPHFKGISPEAGMERYIASIQRAAEYLIETHDAEITFLSTCQGIPEYRWDDSKVAEDVVRRLTPAYRSHCIVETDFVHPSDIMHRVANLDLVIATRMHMGILALISGTPVLPIAYEFKTTELFLRLGLGRWTQDIETVTPEELVASLHSFLDELPRLRADLFRRVDAERIRALESGAVLGEVVNGSSEKERATDGSKAHLRRSQQ